MNFHESKFEKTMHKLLHKYFIVNHDIKVETR